MIKLSLGGQDLGLGTKYFEDRYRHELILDLNY